jgi:hypothetical protein
MHITSAQQVSRTITEITTHHSPLLFPQKSEKAIVGRQDLIHSYS